MKSLTFIILLALAAGGCKKDAPDADLPEATQTGANTAGCYINGQPFVATGFGSGLGKVPGIGGGFSEDSLYNLRLSGKFGNQEGTLRLFLTNIPRDGRVLIKTYQLNLDTPFCPPAVSSQCLNHAVFIPNDYSGEIYGTSARHTGKVDLKYVDLGRSIASGTFSFTAVSNLDPTKTLQVTGGRFDRQQ